MLGPGVLGGDARVNVSRTRTEAFNADYAGLAPHEAERFLDPVDWRDPGAVQFSATPAALASRIQREYQWLAPPILPNGADLSAHGRPRLDQVAAELNVRPCKTLGWRTPEHTLNQLLDAADHGLGPRSGLTPMA